MAKKYDEALEQKIVDYYNKGISPYKMVKMIPELNGKRPSVVYGVLKRLGIEPNRKIELTDEQKLGRRKYNVDDNYFNVINSEEKAYWLGFIYADGFVNTLEDRIGISLNVKDKNHLEKFKTCINSESPINDYEEKSGYAVGSMYSRILITSKQLKQDLIRLGVVENKTNILNFPTYSQVPKKLISHFIRGYMDGDGSITNGNNSYLIKFTGTKEVIEGIQRELNTNVALEERFPERNVNNYSITIGGNIQVKRILEYIYKDSTIFLDRKYLKYKSICN